MVILFISKEEAASKTTGHKHYHTMHVIQINREPNREANKSMNKIGNVTSAITKHEEETHLL
jgi:hypothetical protein